MDEQEKEVYFGQDEEQDDKVDTEEDFLHDINTCRSDFECCEQCQEEWPAYKARIEEEDFQTYITTKGW